ncbi:MAG: hypothetical protein CVT93_09115 [Bacteroidetes bacterium HGW-Bacteroidetes-10]|nr:MAG: hypothetical protein CVT93_09115 [Bacteroidetes bacterium HGW-Bacteroidetes-10]
MKIKRKILRFLILAGLLEGKPAVKQSITAMHAEELISRLDRIVVKNQLYTSPDLTIRKLAKEAGTNRTYLSRCIRIVKRVNYCDYINSYRLDHAVKIIESSPSRKPCLAEISELAGFPNHRSFNRSFVSRYGKTPSEFRREHLRRNSC